MPTRVALQLTKPHAHCLPNNPAKSHSGATTPEGGQQDIFQTACVRAVSARTHNAATTSPTRPSADSALLNQPFITLFQALNSCDNLNELPATVEHSPPPQTNGGRKSPTTKVRETPPLGQL
eukprot:GHRQ01014458.1.p1 GENE.GHRQ01014458.1~~GHRQ01014458.1.p1  ORF type:complete len:122 (+),score=7.09 GHRQ01014458.1:1032-1397(+)